MRQLARRLIGAISAIAMLSGCARNDSNFVRGRGLSVAQLSARDRAHVYEAATRVAFDVSDPSLSLLLDPRQLPRTVGLAATGRVSDDVRGELRARGVIKGSCEPPLQGVKGTAHCKAPLPGYVLRFSPVFSLHGDTVQVYLFSQKYDTQGSGISQTLRFERAYKVVAAGGEWRAIAEGTVPKTVRGEPR